MKSIVLTLTLGALAISCGNANLKSRTQLRDDVRSYNDGIRWRNLPASSMLIPPKERDAFLEEREEVDEELRIGDYEVKRVRYNDARTRALVHVKWTWHMDNEGIVRDTTSRQLWKRYGKQWLMVEEFRVRGDEMPGIPEPPSDEDAESEQIEPDKHPQARADKP